MSIVLFWSLVALFGVSAVITVSMVGKPRAATTPGVAAFTVLVDALLIASLFAWGGVR